MTHQVFISYSHKDSNFVDQLKQHLKDAGFDVWIDRELLMPGQDWREEIDNAIRASFALIAVMTPKAYESKYVTYEWAFALGIGKTVVPIMLEKTKIHPRLFHIHHVDFTEHWVDNWNKLIKPLQALTRELDNPPTDRPPFILRAIAGLDSYKSDSRESALESIMQSKHLCVVDVLAEAVQHHLPDVSMKAAFLLTERTECEDLRAVPGLIEAVRKNYRQSKAIGLLGKFGDPRAIPTLVALLEQKQNEYSNHEIIASLTEIGEPSISAMLSCLNSPNYVTRLSALKVIGRLGDKNITEFLLPLLNDEVASVRGEAIQSLLKLGENNHINELVKILLEDNDIGVRTLAVQSLGKLKVVDAVEQLIAVLQKSSYSLNQLFEDEQHAKEKREGDRKSIEEHQLAIVIKSQKKLSQAIIESLAQIDTPEARLVIAEWRINHPDIMFSESQVELDLDDL